MRYCEGCGEILDYGSGFDSLDSVDSCENCCKGELE